MCIYICIRELLVRSFLIGFIISYVIYIYIYIYTRAGVIQIHVKFAHWMLMLDVCECIARNASLCIDRTMLIVDVCRFAWMLIADVALKVCSCDFGSGLTTVTSCKCTTMVCAASCSPQACAWRTLEGFVGRDWCRARREGAHRGNLDIFIFIS